MKTGDGKMPVGAEMLSYRKERFNFQFRQFRRQWKIYYHSAYGKAGFYILVAFALITILTPVIQFHNANTFFAPQEDAYVASLELNAHVINNPGWNISEYPPAASALSTSGSYVVYVGTPHGQVYGVGLGGAGGPYPGRLISMLNLSLPPGASMYAPLVFPLNNYQRFVSSGFNSVSFDNYIAVVTTNGILHIGRVAWSGSNIPGSGKPFLVNNGTYLTNSTVVLPPVSNAQPTTYGLPPWVPFDSQNAVPLGFSNGQLYLVVLKNGSYYVNAYNDYPLSPAWSYRLNGSSVPSLPCLMGNYYENPNQAMLLIEQGSNVTSINPYSGKVLWSINTNITLNTRVGVYIPYGYQLGFNSFNKVYVASGNTVYSILASNGTVQKIFTAPGSVTGISSSSAIAEPNPQYFAVQTNDALYLMNGMTGYSPFPKPVALPAGPFGSYTFSPIFNGNTRNFVAGTNLGNFVAILPLANKVTVKWHVDYSLISKGASISSPVLLINSESGAQSFAFLTSSGYLAVYSTSGHDTNPFPPTLHSPSGNIYLLGTNTEGQDVWSQLIASFAPAWEVGIGVALVTIAISVVVAMIVGYLGGFVGSIFETFSLVIFLIPFIALLIVIASILNPSLEGAILVLSAVAWPFTTFTLIGLVRSIKSHSFIEAAKVSGARSMQILRRHMLSNMTPLLAYLTAVNIGGAVAAISTLQFLGVVSLTTVTWGSMLQPILNNFYFAAIAPWWILPPSIALTMFIFAFVFVSRGMDEVVNPRLRRR